jgi:uncharacterized membrane protein affecting hemolysin expression
VVSGHFSWRPPLLLVSIILRALLLNWQTFLAQHQTRNLRAPDIEELALAIEIQAARQATSARESSGSEKRLILETQGVVSRSEIFLACSFIWENGCNTIQLLLC